MKIRIVKQVCILGTTYPVGTEFRAGALNPDLVRSLHLQGACEEIPEPPATSIESAPEPKPVKRKRG